MKIFVVFGVFALLGSALGGDENVNDRPPSTISCPHIPDDELERTMTPGYNDMASDCIPISKLDDELANLTTFDEYRQHIKEDFCEGAPTIENCLANITTVSQTCQNVTQHQKLTIFVAMLVTSLDIVCKQDGRDVAMILHAVKSSDEEEENVASCFQQFSRNMASGSKADLETSSKFLFLYRNVNRAKQCFHDRIEREDVRDAMDSIIVEFINKMKCVHPENGSTVLCSTIANNNNNNN